VSFLGAGKQTQVEPLAKGFAFRAESRVLIRIHTI
jgi:hypothetical protein